MSTKACKSGEVFVNSQKAKPSTLIEVGHHIEVKKNGFHYQFESVKLLEKRVSAAIAVDCYINKTPEEELNKYKSWFIGKGKAEIRDKGSGRPTKKDRRELDDYKEDRFEFYFDDED